MTEAQLEIAVYNYCGMMGLNAHEDVPIKSDSEWISYEKRFHVVKRMIESHYAIMKSIEFAMNPPKDS